MITEIFIIKLNMKTFEITISKEIDTESYIDKEIVYSENDICMVCFERCNINAYRRILIKYAIDDCVKELIDANKEICRLNNDYLKLAELLL